MHEVEIARRTEAAFHECRFRLRLKKQRATSQRFPCSALSPGADEESKDFVRDSCQGTIAEVDFYGLVLAQFGICYLHLATCRLLRI